MLHEPLTHFMQIWTKKITSIFAFLEDKINIIKETDNKFGYLPKYISVFWVYSNDVIKTNTINVQSSELANPGFMCTQLFVIVCNNSVKLSICFSLFLHTISEVYLLVLFFWCTKVKILNIMINLFKYMPLTALNSGVTQNLKKISRTTFIRYYDIYIEFHVFINN